MKSLTTSNGQKGQRSSRMDRNVNTSPNIDIAGRLDEVANIFAEQGANRFRVQAYRKAANRASPSAAFGG